MERGRSNFRGRHHYNRGRNSNCNPPQQLCSPSVPELDRRSDQLPVSGEMLPDAGDVRTMRSSGERRSSDRRSGNWPVSGGGRGSDQISGKFREMRIAGDGSLGSSEGGQDFEIQFGDFSVLGRGGGSVNVSEHNSPDSGEMPSLNLRGFSGDIRSASGRGWSSNLQAGDQAVLGSDQGYSSGQNRIYGQRRPDFGGGYGSRGSGGGRGRGRTIPGSASIQRPALVADPCASKLPTPVNLQQLQQSPLSGVKAIPVQPRNGGVKFTNICLYVNHFPIKFDPQQIIIHYHIDIEQEPLPKHTEPVKIAKWHKRMIKNELFSKFLTEVPVLKTVYDGEKSIFSAVRLLDGNSSAKKFAVDVSTGEDGIICKFTVSIKLVNELELHRLADYLMEPSLQIPHEILQGMDLVMRENPTKCCNPIGRGFYSKTEIDLKGGLIAFEGFQQSLKPTGQGLVSCVDYSVLAFQKPIPVIDLLKECVKNLNPDFWDDLKRVEVESALKGLIVKVNHRRTRQKYRVMGLTKDVSSKVSFGTDGVGGRQVTGIIDFFKEKYGINIRYRNLPCLDLSKNGNENYVPMECCELIGWQMCPVEIINKNQNAAQRWREISSPNPKTRMLLIQDIVKADYEPCGGGVAETFGISMETEMTKVTGHIIEPPALRVGSASGKRIKIQPESQNSQWDLNRLSLLSGKEIKCWGILDFSSPEPDNTSNFTRELMSRCDKLQIYIKNPPICEQSDMSVLSTPDQLRRLLTKMCDKVNGRFQILICVMTRKDPAYKSLKLICETEMGIVTQCCLSKNTSQAKPRFVLNLALKITTKLGGSNFELFDRLRGLDVASHVMFVGADVNHPAARNMTGPSVAAVVATKNWPGANQYARRYCLQDNQDEQIRNFGKMCLELLDEYVRVNGVKPDIIVVFRDGVGEGQFDMVRNIEQEDLKENISSGQYSPKITLIVAQKRHHTRMFRVGEDGTSIMNALPGTVVDSNIVDLKEVNFYLFSHQGILGVSKPTHYHVLSDENNFTSHQLQEIIYNLCYTVARCTKPVSLVPPVYYADMFAYRGRQHYEAYTDGLSKSSSSSSSSLPPMDLWSNACEPLKVHPHIANAFFFG